MESVQVNVTYTYSAAAHVYDVIPYELATDGQVTQK